MNKLILTLAFCFAMFGCTTPIECPDCEACPPVIPCDGCCVECPDTLVCPEGYTLAKGDLAWACIEDEIEPPPHPPIEPAAYISTIRAQRIIYNVEVESRSDIYLDIWSSVRDNNVVANNCADICEDVLFMSANELKALGREGEVLINQWTRRWKPNLDSVNADCEIDSRYCGKSNVRKDFWTPYLEQLRERRALTNLNRGLVYKDPLANCSFDTIAGWCSCRNSLR